MRQISKVQPLRQVYQGCLGERVQLGPLLWPHLRRAQDPLGIFQGTVQRWVHHVTFVVVHSIQLLDVPSTELQAYAADVGIDFTASGMDTPSLEFLHEMKVPFLKIGSGDINNILMFERVAEKLVPAGAKIIFSTGMSDMDQVKRMYNTLTRNGSQKCPVVIFQCSSAYPAPDSTLNLNVIPTYKREFPEAVIGYSG